MAVKTLIITIERLREKAEKVESHQRIPYSYVEKYNDLGGTVPGGKAWVMWFIDQVEKGKI